LSGKIDLHLLQRRPDEWRAKHLGVVRGRALAAAEVKPAFSLVQGKKEEEEEGVVSGKRTAERDEIDDLFATVDKKKSKKAKIKA